MVRSFAAALLIIAAFAQQGWTQEAPVEASTEVSPLVITPPPNEAPAPRVRIIGFPRGAPNYSVAQTASYLCGVLNGAPSYWGSVQQARERHDATVHARTVRREALLGLRSEAEMRAAELRRQKALIAAHQSLLPGVPFNREQTLRAMTPYPQLKFENVRESRVFERGKAVLLISGDYRNTSGTTVILPPLQIRPIDENGFVLAQRQKSTDRTSIGPNETQHFSVKLINPPQYTDHVQLYFDLAFGAVGGRDCERFDLASFDPRQDSSSILAGPTARDSRQGSRPSISQRPHDYRSEELARLEAFFMPAFLETANVPLNPAAGCEKDGAAIYWPWRTRLKLAELFEEAWWDTRLADEYIRLGRSDLAERGEVEAAEAARLKSVVRAIEAAKAAGQGVGEGATSIATEALKLAKDEPSRSVVFSGRHRNSGASPVNIPPRAILLSDRFGVPLVTFVAPNSAKRIPAGESQAFAYKIELPDRLPADLVESAEIGGMPGLCPKFYAVRPPEAAPRRGRRQAPPQPAQGPPSS